MGGMAVLEWPLCSPPGYVRHIIPLATSARHSAWCISWGEAQRQSIYSDPSYQDGFYTTQPASGLAAARMSALLTYRTRDSFENRFGRKPQLGGGGRTGGVGGGVGVGIRTPPTSPRPDHVAMHNNGHRNAKPRSLSSSTLNLEVQVTEMTTPSPPPIFSAQSYLRYQGDKFTARFDANCYIQITRKMDTHDVSRGRGRRWRHGASPCSTPPLSDLEQDSDPESESQALARVLSTLPPRAFIIGIETDGLFTTTEQKELAAHIPDAELVVIPSPDGHDGFLLEFEAINGHVLRFLRREFPEYYVGGEEEESGSGNFEVKKTSMFGEAEVDIANW